MTHWACCDIATFNWKETEMDNTRERDKWKERVQVNKFYVLT